MIKEFTIGAGHTFSPRQYESYRVEGSITVTVNEGDDYEELLAKAQVALRAQIVDTYQKQQRKDATNDRKGR